MRRLWRHSETFVFSGIAAGGFEGLRGSAAPPAGGRFPNPNPGALLPDTATREVPIAHLCRRVALLRTETPPAAPAAAPAAATATGEGVSYHLGPWSYSPHFATYSLDAAAVSGRVGPDQG